jgi:hypothetical protein
MKKFFFLFLFFPVIIYAQERISLNGNVFDGVTFFPIEGANIYNFNSKQHIFSNKEGIFLISVKKGDTVIITKPAYKQISIEIDEIILKNKKIEVPLYYKAIMLKEVNIFALPVTYEDLKREFSKSKLSNIYKPMEWIDIPAEERAYIKAPKRKDMLGIELLQFIPGGSSPITALYNKFSKKAKMERLYQELVENEEEVKRLPLKYNRDIVSSLTGLEGEELLNFMTFCRFSYYDLIRWSPEFILSQIHKKFSDYEFYKALEDN